MSSSFTLSEEELEQDPNDIFTVLNKLGEGSYGAVYKGIHIRHSTRLICTQDIDTLRR
jgi:serine/threonine protein kinase